MRQDAARSISQQLSRPDVSGCAGFRVGTGTDVMKALKRWEEKNDPFRTNFKGKLIRRTEEPQEIEAQHIPPDVADKGPKGESSYRRKLRTLPADQVKELRRKQAESAKARAEKILAERLASMTPEEISVFRKRSERMKKFRAELKERKKKTE